MKIYKRFVVMRKVVNLLTLVVVSAMALYSCKMVEVEERSVAGEEYTFALESVDDTKATIGESVKWESGDKVGTFTAMSVNRYSLVTASDGETPASISIYANGGLSVNDMIYCYYPYSSEAGDDKSAVTLSIPVAQTEKDAMPMVSIPFEVTEASNKNQTPYSGIIKFVNLGSVMELNLYSETPLYAEEKIEYVEFQSDQAVAGNFEYDITSVDYSDESTLVISGYSEKIIRYTPSEPLAIGTSKVDAVKVNMVVAPGSYTGKVVVYTDKAIYTYDIATAKQFSRSVAKPFGLNLRENVRSNYPASAFALTDEIQVGDEVIFASGAEGTVSVLGPQTTNNRDAVEGVSVLEGVIVHTSDMARFVVGEGTTNISYYTFYDAVECGYLYAASSTNNHLKTRSSVNVDAEWNVVFNGGEANVVAQESSNRKILRYNSDNTLFSCYEEGKQSPVYIYKKTTATSISAIPSESVLSYEAGTSEINYVVANPSGVTTVEAGANVTVTAHDEANSTVAFAYTANTTGVERTLSVSIINNGKTKVVEIVQKPAPIQLVMSEVTSTPSETSIYYSWTKVTGATGYEVKTTGDWEKVEGTSYTYTGLVANTSYTVQFRALGDGIDFTTSEPISCTAKTIESGTPVYYYVKITKEPDDWSGTYLIMFDDNKAHSYVSGSDLSSNYSSSLTIEDDKIRSEAANSDLDAVVISKKGAGYKIKLSNSKYLTVPKSNAVGNNSETNAAELTITYTDSGVKISGVDSDGNTRYLCKNGNYFRMYKTIGSYKLPDLYKLQDN